MIIVCERCGRYYDDSVRWTICPHGPLGFSPEDYCPKCDTLKSVHGSCEHQQEGTFTIIDDPYNPEDLTDEQKDKINRWFDTTQQSDNI